MPGPRMEMSVRGRKFRNRLTDVLVKVRSQSIHNPEIIYCCDQN